MRRVKTFSGWSVTGQIICRHITASPLCWSERRGGAGGHRDRMRSHETRRRETAESWKMFRRWGERDKMLQTLVFSSTVNSLISTSHCTNLHLSWPGISSFTERTGGPAKPETWTTNTASHFLLAIIKSHFAVEYSGESEQTLVFEGTGPDRLSAAPTCYWKIKEKGTIVRFSAKLNVIVRYGVDRAANTQVTFSCHCSNWQEVKYKHVYVLFEDRIDSSTEMPNLGPWDSLLKYYKLTWITWGNIHQSKLNLT